MKLYTEEQVQEAYNRGHMDGRLNNIDYSITDGFKPIKLPSDEEIYELMDNLPFSKHIGDESFNYGQRKGFELGIKYVRHQIIKQKK